MKSRVEITCQEPRKTRRYLFPNPDDSCVSDVKKEQRQWAEKQRAARSKELGGWVKSTCLATYPGPGKENVKGTVKCWRSDAMPGVVVVNQYAVVKSKERIEQLGEEEKEETLSYKSGWDVVHEGTQKSISGFTTTERDAVLVADKIRQEFIAVDADGCGYSAIDWTADEKTVIEKVRAFVNAKGETGSQIIARIRCEFV